MAVVRFRFLNVLSTKMVLRDISFVGIDITTLVEARQPSVLVNTGCITNAAFGYGQVVATSCKNFVGSRNLGRLVIMLRGCNFIGLERKDGARRLFYAEELTNLKNR